MHMWLLIVFVFFIAFKKMSMKLRKSERYRKRENETVSFLFAGLGNRMTRPVKCRIDIETNSVRGKHVNTSAPEAIGHSHT